MFKPRHKTIEAIKFMGLEQDESGAKWTMKFDPPEPPGWMVSAIKKGKSPVILPGLGDPEDALKWKPAKDAVWMRRTDSAMLMAVGKRGGEMTAHMGDYIVRGQPDELGVEAHFVMRGGIFELLFEAPKKATP